MPKLVRCFCLGHHEALLSFDRSPPTHIPRLRLYSWTDNHGLSRRFIRTREARTAYSRRPFDHRPISLDLLLLCPRTRTLQDVQWQYYQINYFRAHQQSGHGAYEETVTLLDSALCWDVTWLLLLSSVIKAKDRMWFLMTFISQRRSTRRNPGRMSNVGSPHISSQ